MGTASLVFGLILIVVGVYITSEIMKLRFDEEEFLAYLVGFAIIPVPMFVIGGLLLRKYDRDKKKK